jgi:Eukaryotic aspartyl protease
MSVGFEPTSSISVENGVLTFGGTSASHFTGGIGYTPITSTSPASEFWGINQMITYGGAEIMTQTAGIVDTGTTLILLPNRAFRSYNTPSFTYLPCVHHRGLQPIPVADRRHRRSEHRTPYYHIITIRQPPDPELCHQWWYLRAPS